MKKTFIVAVATSLVLASGASAAFADNGSDTSIKSSGSVSVELGKDQVKLTSEQKVAFKAERDAYKEKREAILATFKTSKKSAKATFKAAREAATTEEARIAAEVAFKTAISIAVQIKTDALTALGAPPVKPTLTAEQKAALEVEIAKYLAARVAINATFKTAMIDAQAAFKTARILATTDEARKAAAVAFKTAVRKATTAKNAALKALGDRPTFTVNVEVTK